MVEVNLWSGLRSLTGGELAVTVEATTIGEMLDALVAAHPGLGPAIEAGVSVVVDGEIISVNRSVALGPANEVFIVRKVRGG